MISLKNIRGFININLIKNKIKKKNNKKYDL